MNAIDAYRKSEKVIEEIENAAKRCVEELILKRVEEVTNKGLVGVRLPYQCLLDYYDADKGKPWAEPIFSHINNQAYKHVLNRILKEKYFIVTWYDSKMYVQLLWHDSCPLNYIEEEENDCN